MPSGKETSLWQWEQNYFLFKLEHKVGKKDKLPVLILYSQYITTVKYAYVGNVDIIYRVWWRHYFYNIYGHSLHYYAMLRVQKILSLCQFLLELSNYGTMLINALTN